jgi:hypothetical protein
MKHKLDLIENKYSEEELEANIHLFDIINWNFISQFQNLSEEFIEKHSGKVHWYKISVYQNLSEKFIEKHLVEVNWAGISLCQELSEQFIKKHIRKINFYYLMINDKISNKIKDKIEKEFYLLKEII